MKLHYLHFPNDSNNTILILHGLFGSSKNWISIAKKLSLHLDVFALDLRNHGDSPHSDDHSLEDMIFDIEEFIRDHNLQKVILLGHSMGGLVTMGLALQNKTQIEKLIVVDIAPKIYPPHHHKEFLVLNTDVSKFSSRSEIDHFLKNIHGDDSIRQFLMMNLVKTEKGYQWKLNTKALEKGKYLKEVQNWNGRQAHIPTLFIRALNSNYILEEDYIIIKKFFPNANIKELLGNHWIHYTNEKEFLYTVIDFLKL